MPILPVGEVAQQSELPFSKIQEATNNFKGSSEIGHGGHSKVYKGSITVGENLDMSVAIKRLIPYSRQGETEFLAEREIQSKLRHTNLVSLIGYCIHGDKERINVSEYMPKGTLEDRLHRREFPPLTFARRLKILIGTGRGLDHLHTGTGIKDGVIHCDLKPANILLDNNFEPKICDFRLSRIGLTKQTSDHIKGTLCYVDPSYLTCGIPTPQHDVFSFGVTMLEVLSGRKPIDTSLDDENKRVMRIWAQECVRKNTRAEIVDANLKQGAGAISDKCLYLFVQLAMWCLHDTAEQRPTMAQVVEGLETIRAKHEKAYKKRIKNMKKGKPHDYLNLLNWRKNPVGGTSLKSLKFHLYTVGGEKRILHQFSINTINAASENFSIANKILDDEFGTMYKGKLQNGQDIAIYGPSSDTKYELYKNETSILVNVEHENLIQLLGYCIDGTNVYLVYDFAPYTTLDLLISDCSSDQLYKILQGVARVLLYLHSHAPVRVIHSDVKSGKIMLDKSLNPKLFGFYYARSIAMTEVDCIYVAEADCIDVARPSPECWAPEYKGKDRALSTKCDVFNFGVLVLTTVTAERIEDPSAALFLDDIVRRKWREGAYSNKAESEMTKRFIMVGLLCIQTDATQRPRMEEVVAMLMGTSNALLKAIKLMNREEPEMGIKTTKSNSARSAEASTSASHPWCVGSSS